MLENRSAGAQNSSQVRYQDSRCSQGHKSSEIHVKNNENERFEGRLNCKNCYKVHPRCAEISAEKNIECDVDQLCSLAAITTLQY
jgi:hypothetical protein